MVSPRMVIPLNMRFACTLLWNVHAENRICRERTLENSAARSCVNPDGLEETPSFRIMSASVENRRHLPPLQLRLTSIATKPYFDCN